jgi:hypothetical protein
MKTLSFEKMEQVEGGRACFDEAASMFAVRDAYMADPTNGWLEVIYYSTWANLFNCFSQFP